MVTSSDIHEVYMIAVGRDEFVAGEVKKLLVGSLGEVDRTVYEYLKMKEWEHASTIAGMHGMISQNTSRSLKKLVELDLVERKKVEGIYKYRRL